MRGHAPGELSGGQQQRVAIARALVKEPDVLLADEPTGNLDEGTRDEIMDLLEGLWREHGLTFMMVTHDSAVARRAERRLHIKRHGDRAIGRDTCGGCRCTEGILSRRAYAGGDDLSTDTDTDARSRRATILRRRRIVAGAAVAAIVAGGCTVAWTLSQQSGPPAESAAADAAVAVPPPAPLDPAGTSPGALDTAGLSPGVAAQIQYVHEHWDDTESEQFGAIPENDCVNFTSQTLLARGWTTDDEWWYDEGGNAYLSSDAWISSTNLMWYLEDHPERATALTDDQRDQVKVGDVVQFDWDRSGDRDHTGVVTSVVTEEDGSITIRYGGHTDPTWNRSVDWAITELHPGGDV